MENIILFIVTAIFVVVLHKLTCLLLEYQKMRHAAAIETERRERERQCKHRENMKRLHVEEQTSRRRDTIEDKKCQLEHDRVQSGQTQLFSIIGDVFKKVEVVDMNQAVFSALLMQHAHSGKEIDHAVLDAVAAKVPTPLPGNIEQVVAKVIQNYTDGTGEFENCKAALSPVQEEE